MALGLDFWIQLLVVLAALFYGARKGGMGLGLPTFWLIEKIFLCYR